MPRFVYFLSSVLIFLIAQFAFATDVIREQQLAADLASRTNKDETVWLETEDQRYNALFLDSVRKETHGAIILLHGDDAAPDAANLLQPLRKRLPEKGWSTLSLQAPVREQGAEPQELMSLLPEVIGRIEAAIAFLKTRNIERIFMLGHQRGGEMGLRFSAEKPTSGIIAVVAVDLPATQSEQENLLKVLGQIKTPFLDISVSHRPQLADDVALSRKRVMKNNPGYRQRLIADAHSSLREVQELLTNHIHGWLMRLPSPGPSPPAEAKPGT